MVLSYRFIFAVAALFLNETPVKAIFMTKKLNMKNLSKKELAMTELMYKKLLHICMNVVNTALLWNFLEALKDLCYVYGQ
jgi:hypothetical protein